MTLIGNPKRTYTIEPLDDPVTASQPAESAPRPAEPVRSPAELPRQPLAPVAVGKRDR